MEVSDPALFVHNLRCEHACNPLGIQEARPLLQWSLQISESSKGQSAYRVVIATSSEVLDAEAANLWGSGKLWDSGKISDSVTQFLVSNVTPVSGQRMFWKVMVWDENGHPSDWSTHAWFEFGLLKQADWQGEWIGAGSGEVAPILRREFDSHGDVIQARCYFSGLGYGECYLNDSRLGQDQLSPGWTDYDKREYSGLLYPYDDKGKKRVLYVVYDVTHQILDGKNAVSCLLGNGMHSQTVRTVEGVMNYGKPRMLFNLVIKYRDGREVIVVSSPDWRWSESSIRSNQLFTGEVHDARHNPGLGWARPRFDDSSWQRCHSADRPTGELVSQIYPADRIVNTIEPIGVSDLGDGSRIFDFGQVISGWVEIRVQGEVGGCVVMRFSEELNSHGDLDYFSAGGVDQVQRDEYYLAGNGTETFAPRFVWHTFRYVKIDSPPGIEFLGQGVVAKVVHMDLDVCGEFSCSEKIFERINDTFKATQLANMHGGIVSDCPHRERLGYTGDGQVTCEATMWNFESASFYSKWMKDIFDAQNQDTGFVPHTVPFYGGGGGYAWGSACTIIPWTFAKFYGDLRPLRENYEGMKLWLKYIEAHTDELGVVFGEEPGSWCLGDWSFPLAGDVPIAAELVNTYFLIRNLELLRDIASILERASDRIGFSERLGKARSDFHRAFYDKARGCYGNGRGGADAFALAAKAVPESEMSRVLQSLKENSTQFDTGIFGTPLLLDVLSDNGFGELAYDLMASDGFPSVGFMLRSGATTLWESWRKEEGSHCHPMFGSVCAWFFRHVVGLSQTHSSFGFRDLVWRPSELSRPSSAGLKFNAPSGEISLSWEKNADGISATAVLPPGTMMRIVCPRSELGHPYRLMNDLAIDEVRIGPGKHELDFRPL